MVFSSFSFILQYFPVVAGGYAALQKLKKDQYKTLWLLACSLSFYLFWNPWDLAPLLVSSVINYGFFQIMRGRKNILIVGILFNLLFLAWYKYAFLIQTAFPWVNFFFATPPKEIPLGISFYTFTQIAFLISAYQAESLRLPFSQYALFVSYFPHLVCGPILLFKDFHPQIARKEHTQINWDNVIYCLFFFSLGLFKKLYIADVLGLYVSEVFDHTKTDAVQYIAYDYRCLALGVFWYAFQLYADFSGYSDMAVGISRLFGITIPFNFHSPYRASSIVEFWRKWHISLSEFLKNYVYIPLGGSQCSAIRHYINLVLTMFLGGLWHGGALMYGVWGLYQGSLLAINHALRKLSFRWYVPFKNFFKPIKIAGVFILVNIGWVFFRSQDMKQALFILKSIFLMRSTSHFVWIYKAQWISFALAIIFSFILPETPQLYEKTIEKSHSKNFIVVPTILGFLLAFSFLRLNNPQHFLYSGF